MGLTELILIAIGLSMDAFAVSICKGLSVTTVKPRHAASVGIYFGVFQAVMPLIGFFLGTGFRTLIEDYDHWVAFGLLGLIGGNMIKEAFSKDEDEQSDSFSFRVMLTLAIATSIDALAVGVSFAVLDGINIYKAVILIGVITCILSAVGIYIGNIFGARYKSKAEFAGGTILILIGLKILFEHLGILSL